jgi:hypothetical protein
LPLLGVCAHNRLQVLLLRDEDVVVYRVELELLNDVELVLILKGIKPEVISDTLNFLIKVFIELLFVDFHFSYTVIH